MGVAHWKGTIAPGQVSDALVSTTDFLPTIATLAGVALPTDRSFDGVDLSSVILHGNHSAGHRTLFHPSGGGYGPTAVSAMRLGKYKAHFMTHGSTGCRLPDGTARGGSGKTKRFHDPPLIFDLASDPAESTPVDPTTIPSVVAEIQREYQAFWHDVNTTMRSTTSYAGNPADRPCSNEASSCCRLPATLTL